MKISTAILVLLLGASSLTSQTAVGRLELDPSQQPQRNEAYVAPFTVAPDPPKLPKVDLNACPFEGCQFGSWTARTTVGVYSTWHRSKEQPQIATIQKAEKVTALSGVNVVLRPGKGIFTRDVAMFGASKGDLVYMYMDCGEGAVDIWTHGRFIKCSEPNFWKPGYEHDCNGRYLELGESERRVKIRLSDGRIGWVLVTDNFDGTDALE